jgi:hypothetical protein
MIYLQIRVISQQGQGHIRVRKKIFEQISIAFKNIFFCLEMIPILKF